jgi:hypothetical protein
MRNDECKDKVLNGRGDPSFQRYPAIIRPQPILGNRLARKQDSSPLRRSLFIIHHSAFIISVL